MIIFYFKLKKSKKRLQMKNLVEYSGSDDSSDNDDKDKDVVPPKKTKLQLPMLLDQKSAVDRDEKPEHHQMRTRSIPHVEGNWASHIKVDCECHLETLLRCLILTLNVLIF